VLCNRLVIMIKGQLVCIGASQELKTRFGAGYDIHIKLNPSRSDEDVEKIKDVMNSSLTCEIRDENLVIIVFCLEIRNDFVNYFTSLFFCNQFPHSCRVFLVIM